jgi:hypothetical protein
MTGRIAFFSKIVYGELIFSASAIMRNFDNYFKKENTVVICAKRKGGRKWDWDWH